MSIAIAPPRGNAAGIVVSTGQIARRVLLKFIRSPQLVVVGTLQGAMFLLIFRYVFGGAIAIKGINYVDFVVPGFITTGVLFTAMYASAGMAEDMSAGLIARLRSLPIPRSAVLVGRAVADTVAPDLGACGHGRNRLPGGLPHPQQRGRRARWLQRSSCSSASSSNGCSS